MTFLGSVKTCLWKRCTKISGRATRAEYWWFFLFTFVTIGIGMTVLYQLHCIGEDMEDPFYIIPLIFGILLLLYVFMCSISGFCVTVRRLHDTGHSGWYLLWCIIPVLLWPSLLAKCCEDNYTYDFGGFIDAYAGYAIVIVTFYTILMSIGWYIPLYYLLSDSAKDNRYGLKLQMEIPSTNIEEHVEERKRMLHIVRIFFDWVWKYMLALLIKIHLNLLIIWVFFLFTEDFIKGLGTFLEEHFLL